MITASVFLRRPIKPEEMLDGVRETSAKDHRWAFSLYSNWVNAETYLSWAQESVQLDTDFGLSAAVNFAKRAVCRRIDGLIVHRHLRCVLQRDCTTKLKSLQKTGLRILPIVSKYVIDERNVEEHDYRQPNLKAAEDSVQIAELFIKSTGEEGAIIAVGGDLSGFFPAWPTEIIAVEEGHFSPSNFPIEPFVFIDVFGKPETIKLVISKDSEILTTPLGKFTPEQGIELWKLISREEESKLPGGGSVKGGGVTMQLDIFSKIKELTKI